MTSWDPSTPKPKSIAGGTVNSRSTSLAHELKKALSVAELYVQLAGGNKMGAGGAGHFLSYPRAKLVTIGLSSQTENVHMPPGLAQEANNCI